MLLCSFSETMEDKLVDVLSLLNDDIQATEGVQDLRETLRSVPDIIESNLLPKVEEESADAAEKTNYQRLVEVNAFVLRMNGEKCMEHRYDKMVEELSNSTWSSAAGVGGRQWLYQVKFEALKNSPD